MAVDTWDEIRTAFHVARAGTVSGAAESLGVHHATVIRHVGALEDRLGVKLFQRHARGYTPTEAGLDLLTVARTTDDQFEQLVSRIRGRGEEVTGELVVTSLHSVSPLLVPVLARFRAAHPGLVVRYLTGDRILRLEYGEAHVAVRAGAPPENPDNVVQRFLAMPMALYGSQDYLSERGVPRTEGDLASHDFVSLDDPESRAPFARWLRERVAPERVVFRRQRPAHHARGDRGGGRAGVRELLGRAALAYAAPGAGAVGGVDAAAVAGHPRGPAPDDQGAGVPHLPQGGGPALPRARRSRHEGRGGARAAGASRPRARNPPG